MSYIVENVNDCTKKLVFNFEAVDLASQVEKALRAKQKSSNLKGFRKGKAPLSIIKEMYGPQVENEALYQFVSQQFFEAIQKEDLQAIGQPSFDKTNYEREQSKLEFEAVVEVLPTFEIADYSNYEFTKMDDTLSENDVDDLRKRYLESKAQMVEVEDQSAALSQGQFAVINFQGEKEDGEKPENMKGEEYLLEIGSGQFIPGFEEQLVGMKATEKKSISLTFPQDYQEESLQGAAVTFHVELLEVKEKKLPELTDELAKEFGFESAEDFESKARSNLQAQKTREAQSKLQQEVLEKLVSENQFDVPKALIEQQKKALTEELTSTLKQQGFNDDMVRQYFGKWQDDLESKAIFQVRSGLILDKLAKKYEIETSEADLDAKIEQMAQQSGVTKDQIEGHYKSNQNIKNNLKYAIREEKTFEKLLAEMKVS